VKHSTAALPLGDARRSRPKGEDLLQAVRILHPNAFSCQHFLTVSSETERSNTMLDKGNGPKCSVLALTSMLGLMLVRQN
jgi:hypothetical protein